MITDIAIKHTENRRKEALMTSTTLIQIRNNIQWYLQKSQICTLDMMLSRNR